MMPLSRRAASLGRIAMLIALVPCLAAPPAAAQFFQFSFGQQPAPPQRQRPALAPAPRPKLLPQPEPTPSAAPTPYDPDLQRLSEILGALHFLRGICGSHEGRTMAGGGRAGD